MQDESNAPTMDTMHELKAMSGKEFRHLCRSKAHQGPSTGVAHGHKQANLVILPEKYAQDFRKFCELNSQACPVLEVLEPGQYKTKLLSMDADVRTDLPKYRLWRNSTLIKEVPEVTEHWNESMVSFFFGCSFSFEAALLRAGVPLRNIEQNKNIPMYKSGIMCKEYGAFRNIPMVVSCRWVPRHMADLVVQITSRFTDTHGAPVHIGEASDIGIREDWRQEADFGDVVEAHEGDVAVFHACGVTSTLAAISASAKEGFDFITHAPGHMFVSDLKEDPVSVAQIEPSSPIKNKSQ